MNFAKIFQIDDDHQVMAERDYDSSNGLELLILKTDLKGLKYQVQADFNDKNQADKAFKKFEKEQANAFFLGMKNLGE